MPIDRLIRQTRQSRPALQIASTHITLKMTDVNFSKAIIAYLGPPSSYTHQVRALIRPTALQITFATLQAAVDSFDTKHFVLEDQGSIAGNIDITNCSILHELMIRQMYFMPFKTLLLLLVLSHSKTRQMAPSYKHWISSSTAQRTSPKFMFAAKLTWMFNIA